MRMTKHAVALAALAALAACGQRSLLANSAAPPSSNAPATTTAAQPNLPVTGSFSPGDPGTPTNRNVTGSSRSRATGGGVPVPAARGGAGGVGTGARPGQN